MAHARKIHRHAVLVCRLHDLVVADAAARLYHGLYASFACDIDAIAEREKRLATKRATAKIQPHIARLGHCRTRGVHAASHTHTDGDYGAVFHVNDAVAFRKRRDLPRDLEVF